MLIQTRAEWDFVQSLSYNDQLHPDDAEFVRLIYTCRLSKVRRAVMQVNLAAHAR